MISAEYFRTRFEEDARQKGVTGRTEVHLVSGIVFEIERVLEVEKGHVVLQVYPPEESEGVAARKRARSDRPAPADASLDRLVVAFESIACLHFAPADRHGARAVGF
jgi:hypothetical protein